jgi:hypothetical protein
MGYTSLLVKTGQTTQYVAGDDGGLEKGVAHSFTVLDTGQYDLTTDITLNGLTDVHSNNCVQDNVTGLMWSRYASASVGADGGKGNIGMLPWTTDVNGEGIFSYVAAANAASLAGHTDWRIPNLFEAITIFEMETGTCLLTDIWQAFWTSTSVPSVSSNAYKTGMVALDKTDIWEWCVLVRGTPTAPLVGVNTLRSLLGAGY